MKFCTAALVVLLTGCVGNSMLWFPMVPVPIPTASPIDNYLPPLKEEREEVPMHTVPGISEQPYISEQPNMPEQLNVSEQYEISQPIPYPTRPMVALTFDDGPSAYTERILDLLEQHNGRATFFVVGSRVRYYRNTIARASDLGNEIANHSWSHPNLTLLSESAVRREIQSTSDAIESVIGFSPPLMRPPYGHSNSRVQSIAGEMGYSIIKWDLDTLDWQHRNPDRTYNVIMTGVRDGSIILLHDLHGPTATAMERVIPALTNRGYQLVTVSELLKHSNGNMIPGRTYP